MTIEKNEQLSEIKSLMKKIDSIKDKIDKTTKSSHPDYLWDDYFWMRKELIYSYVFYLISKDKDLNE